MFLLRLYSAVKLPDVHTAQHINIVLDGEFRFLVYRQTQWDVSE
jgi:hypothetical protein